MCDLSLFDPEPGDADYPVSSVGSFNVGGGRYATIIGPKFTMSIGVSASKPMSEGLTDYAAELRAKAARYIRDAERIDAAVLWLQSKAAR